MFDISQKYPSFRTTSNVPQRYKFNACTMLVKNFVHVNNCFLDNGFPHNKYVPQLISRFSYTGSIYVAIWNKIFAFIFMLVPQSYIIRFFCFKVSILTGIWTPSCFLTSKVYFGRIKSRFFNQPTSRVFCPFNVSQTQLALFTVFGPSFNLKSAH